MAYVHRRLFVYLFYCFEVLGVKSRALHKLSKHFGIELFILHKGPFEKSRGRIKTARLVLKAFSACQTQVRHEGRWLKEEEQLWRERRDDPTANTASPKKIILVGRTKSNLIFSHFSMFVTWMGRLKHGALEPSLSAETRDCCRF